MYDPDRLKYPMKRTNPVKGLGIDPGWVRITWDEALETVATRFRAILDQYGNEALLAVTRPKPELLLRLVKALGMTRVDHNDTCYGVEKVIQKYTVGPKSFGHDFENSKYVLLFGWDMIARNKIVFARGLHTAKSNGAKVSGKYGARMFKLAGVDAIYPPPKYPTPATKRVDGREKLPLADEGRPLVWL